MAILGKSIAVHEYEGHTIEVRLRASPRYLWMAAGFYVRVDEEDMVAPPELYERGATATTFSIQHANRSAEGKVESVRGFGNKMVLRTRYRLTLNGVQIAEGALRAEKWYITLGILGLLFVVTPLIVAIRLRGSP